MVGDELKPRSDWVPSILPENLPCDKILIYCMYPSTFLQIAKVCIQEQTIRQGTRLTISRQVLELYGIKSLQMSGKLLMDQRTSITEEFKKGMRNDPRVLLVSDVGSTGLNIPCANIVIFPVRLFPYHY